MLQGLKRRLKRLVKTDALFSVDDKGNTHLAINLPKSWEELTQEQLHYICVLIANNVQMDMLKYYCFIHFSGFVVVSRWGEKWIIAVRNGLFRRKEMEISNEEVVMIAGRWLSWLDKCGSHPVRLEACGRFKAFNEMLFGLPFEKYLLLENFWQGYIYSKNNEPLCEMARILYEDTKRKRMKDVPEEVASSTALWFSSFKNMCYERWPNLYCRVSDKDEGDEEPINTEVITNQQIRALTGGDITKEKEVLAMDVWRALTELDAKALDAAEQRKQINNIKNHGR